MYIFPYPPNFNTHYFTDEIFSKCVLQKMRRHYHLCAFEKNVPNPIFSTRREILHLIVEEGVVMTFGLRGSTTPGTQEKSDADFLVFVWGITQIVFSWNMSSIE